MDLWRWNRDKALDYNPSDEKGDVEMKEEEEENDNEDKDLEIENN